MGVCRSTNGIEIELSGQVRPILSVLHVFHDAVGRRGDEEGWLKIEASGLSQVIGFFITYNILM